MHVIFMSMYASYLYACNADGRSVVGTASMMSNPNDVMDTYSVVVTCEINPTSTAEYCKVIARNDSAGLPDLSST